MSRLRVSAGDHLVRPVLVVMIAVVAGYLVTVGLLPYPNFLFGVVAVAAIAAIGLNLLVGNAGLVSLATPAFMSTGAYGAGIILERTSLGLAGAVIIPIVVAVLIGGLVGLLALRLHGFYLGLATLGLLEATQYALLNGGSLVGDGYGFAMPIASVGSPISVAAWSGIAVATLILVAAGAWSIRRSSVGRGLALLRHHEVVAGCTGMNIVRLKVGAFALSAGLGALSGVLFGFVQGAVSPEQFGLTLAVSQLAYIVFGGLGTVGGAIIGTAVLLLLPETFRSLGQSQGIINAAVLLLVVIVAPQGMLPLVTATARRWLPRAFERRGARPPAVVGAEPPRVGELLRVRLDEPTRESSTAIRFSDVEVRYGGVVAVKGFSADVRMGSVHGLIGPNGAGKSSAVGALYGLNRLTRGEIFVRGRLMQSASKTSPPWDVASAGVGRTFQTPVAGLDLTVLESVQNGLFSHLHTGYVRGGLRTGTILREERAATELAREALDLVRFTSRHDKTVADLTLGELRRVELARVLVGDPRVIVLDEPTSGMELADADALFELLRELAHSGDRSVLVVEHNVRLIFGYSDDVTVMNLGEVIAHGAPDEISRHTAVKEAYLGAR